MIEVRSHVVGSTSLLSTGRKACLVIPNPPQGAFLIPLLVNIGGSFVGGQGTLYKLNWQVLGIG